MPDKFIETNKKWGEGIIIEFYQGSYSMVLGNRNDNGTYKQWCYPQKRGKERGPIDKAVPWKIPLGDAETAINTLRLIAEAINQENREQPASDDVPF